MRWIIRIRTLALLAVAMVLGACATPTNYIVLLDGEDGKPTGAVVVSNEQGARTLDSAGQAVELTDSPDVAPGTIDDATIERDFAQALEAAPLKPRSFLLYFEFGGSELTEESRQLIPEILAEIRQRPAPNIGVIGHTDTAGGAELNSRLALGRAQKVLSLLLFAGVDESLIDVSSHGENNPLINTGDGVDEPRNRRVEVVIR
ncbi:MAG: OmpA family protein [Pseudomonadota bacterium]